MPATLPLIDGAELARRTMGDPRLQVEILALFVTELERLMRQVDAAQDGQTLSERLLAVAELARSAGAMRLAQVARTTEAGLSAGEGDLAPLRAAVAETLRYVNQASA